MGKTSSEVKQRWNEKTYRRYGAYLRKGEDKELIDWIEDNKDKYSVSDIFRTGVETLMKDEKK